MHLQNDKTEVQIRAKLVELAIGLEKRFSKQNKTTTKKPYTFKLVKSQIILMESKMKIQLSKKDSLPKNPYNHTEVMRRPADSSIDQSIEGKENVLDSSSVSFPVKVRRGRQSEPL